MKKLIQASWVALVSLSVLGKATLSYGQDGQAITPTKYSREELEEMTIEDVEERLKAIAVELLENPYHRLQMLEKLDAQGKLRSVLGADGLRSMERLRQVSTPEQEKEAMAFMNEQEVLHLELKRPIVLFIGGGSDTKQGRMNVIQEKWQETRPHATSHYFSWMAGELQPAIAIAKHRERRPNGKILIVGHSYGGHSAYRIASWWMPDDQVVALLGTLDPVGRAVLRRHNGTIHRPPGVAKWLNVVASESGWIADAGGVWGVQSNASDNIHYEGEHGDAMQMFNRILPTITKIVGKARLEAYKDT